MTRLADEYDAAQERGEAATKGKPVNVPGENIMPMTAAEWEAKYCDQSS